MLYGFKVSTSINGNEPGLSYFLTLEQAASAALASVELTAAQAFSLCEYLDCVDAGDLRPLQPLYRNAVTALTSYLDTCEDLADVRSLTSKSWTAQTLWELVRTAKDKIVSSQHCLVAMCA
jgi:hypothetical protein